MEVGRVLVAELSCGDRFFDLNLGTAAGTRCARSPTGRWGKRQPSSGRTDQSWRYRNLQLRRATRTPATTAQSYLQLDLSLGLRDGSLRPSVVAGMSPAEARNGTFTLSCAFTAPVSLGPYILPVYEPAPMTGCVASIIAL